jgi:hypothetical protein
MRGKGRTEGCSHDEAGVSGAGDGEDGSNVLHFASRIAEVRLFSLKYRSYLVIKY